MANMQKDLLLPGRKVRINGGSSTVHSELLHVRGIVDDMIVTRRWVKHKKRWAYECKSLAYYELMHEHGYLEKA